MSAGDDVGALAVRPDEVGIVFLEDFAGCLRSRDDVSKRFWFWESVKKVEHKYVYHKKNESPKI